MSRIIGFHQDDDGYWVADFDCGHTQHMRHDPPWQERPWVLTRDGRDSRVGRQIECVECAASDANAS